MGRASAALIHGLKSCGLFDETAVSWGGEFGRRIGVWEDANGGVQSLGGTLQDVIVDQIDSATGFNDAEFREKAKSSNHPR
jgi:hypothetical protein